MSILKGFVFSDQSLSISPMPIQRDWAEGTGARHAYHCFPVTTANTIGWYLSSKNKIIFEWDGSDNPTGEAVNIIEGKDFCHANRGHGTVSIFTGIKFQSENNISLWTINPVNYFNPDWEVMSSLMSTSFYNHELPLAIKILQPNKKIVIEPGQPIATIVPISLGMLKNESIDIYDWPYDPNFADENKEYEKAAQALNQKGIWTDWYRDGVNYKGEKIGEHEVKALKLQVNNFLERYNNE
jgi:hypothetical protein